MDLVTPNAVMTSLVGKLPFGIKTSVFSTGQEGVGFDLHSESV